MQYSPKLKMAMEEIKAVLKKHDIAGIAVIHTPGFSEYLFSISPGYSCASIESDRLKIKCKREHFPSEKQRDQTVADTSNMLHHLAQWTGQLFMNANNASKLLDNAVQAEHTGGDGHSSHTQQNN